MTLTNQLASLVTHQEIVKAVSITFLNQIKANSVTNALITSPVLMESAKNNVKKVNSVRFKKILERGFASTALLIVSLVILKVMGTIIACSATPDI